MLNLFSKIAATSVVETETHLFYRIDDISHDLGPKLNLADLVQTTSADGTDLDAVFPEDQVQHVSERYSDKSVWQEIGDSISGSEANPSISNDLHPAIKALLKGSRPELARIWRLTPHARNFLDCAVLFDQHVRKDEYPRKRIQLFPREASSNRLTSLGVEPSPLDLEIDNLHLFTFATGAAFMVARVRYTCSSGRQVTVADMMEATHALSRFNTCRWVARPEGKEEKQNKGPEFSLGGLLRRFVQIEVPKSVLYLRVPSYTQLSLAEYQTPEVLDALGCFVARRYTSDYTVDLENARIQYVRDFENVRHAVSEEGVASIICPQDDGQLPGFLKNWRTNTFQSAYSPLVLMQLHENWFLTKSRSDAVMRTDSETGMLIQRLEEIANSALLFRLCFRFASVSDISMHSAFSRALREALQLDRKLTEMQDDVNTISDRLISDQQAEDAEIQERRHQTFAWIGNLAGATLMGFAVFTILKDVLQLLTTAGDQLVGGLALAIGFVIFVFSYYSGKLRNRPAPPKSENRHRLTQAVRVLQIRG